MITILVGLLVVLVAALFVTVLRQRRAARIAATARRRPPTLYENAVGGGPFMHWVPDHHGGWRLAGDYLPEKADDVEPPVRVRRRRRR
jgi:hypothetical protein